MYWCWDCLHPPCTYTTLNGHPRSSQPCTGAGIVYTHHAPKHHWMATLDPASHVLVLGLSTPTAHLHNTEWPPQIQPAMYWCWHCRLHPPRTYTTLNGHPRSSQPCTGAGIVVYTHRAPTQHWMATPDPASHVLVLGLSSTPTQHWMATLDQTSHVLELGLSSSPTAHLHNTEWPPQIQPAMYWSWDCGLHPQHTYTTLNGHPRSSQPCTGAGIVVFTHSTPTQHWMATPDPASHLTWWNYY